MSKKIAIILFGGLAATLANAIFIDVFEASKNGLSFLDYDGPLLSINHSIP